MGVSPGGLSNTLCSSGDPTRPFVPLSGVLCRGIAVELGWPHEAELDALTLLRNRPQVRERFLDPRPLDLAANREWLRSGMRRPEEGLLAIRLLDDRGLCGMIGWSHWDPVRGSLELGRLAVDSAAARRCERLRHPDYPGVAVDASIALRDYAFSRMDVRVVHTVYFADNAYAARVNRLSGGRITKTVEVPRGDLARVALVHIEMTRQEWESRMQKVARQ